MITIRPRRPADDSWLDVERRPRLPRSVAVLLVGAVLLAVAVIAGATALAPRPAVGAGATVAVIGDSLTAGTHLGGEGTANWTRLVAERRDWTVTENAIGGTGYLRTNLGYGDFAAAQLDRAMAVHPDLVVVEGSLNDVVIPPAPVAAAAGDLFRRIRQGAPQARLVVIGPPWPNADPPANLAVLRDALAGAARQADAVWVDPLAEGWFDRPTDADGEPLIGSDGLHPTNAGHAVMAERIVEALSRAGL